MTVTETTRAALGQATDARAVAVREADARDAEWREAIRAALAADVGATEVARLAGISRERVYQIKDGRR
jgi:DNA-binding phage protein